MLTKEQSDKLKDYFPVKSHEFLQGATYLSEEAITNRLDDIDPSWTWELVSEYTRDNQCIAVGRMTVCGVSRDGVGMQPLQITKKDGTIIDGTEPEKSAITDALKRAARLFGIGRYILEMGRAVTDYSSLEQWLYQRQNKVTSLASENAPQSHQEAHSSDLAQAAGDYQSATPKGAAKLGNSNGGKGSITYPVTSYRYRDNLGKVKAAVQDLYHDADGKLNTFHMNGSIEKLEAAGTLDPNKHDVDLAVEIIRKHKASQEQF